jgi:uncharacterized protein DUF3151
MRDLMAGPPPVLLPDEPGPREALAAGDDPSTVAARWPTSSLAWATLAELSLAGGRPVESYAYARTGYHRGLDALRRNGWKGFGPVPLSHEPNAGVLRSIAALSRSAEAIDETAETERCRQLLLDSDPEALGLLEG